MHLVAVQGYTATRYSSNHLPSSTLQVFFIVGEFALVVIGVAFTSWRGQFAAAAVFCAVTLVLWPVIPESGRWLYVKGQTEQAMQVRPAAIVEAWSR